MGGGCEARSEAPRTTTKPNAAPTYLTWFGVQVRARTRAAGRAEDGEEVASGSEGEGESEGEGGVKRERQGESEG